MRRPSHSWTIGVAGSAAIGIAFAVHLALLPAAKNAAAAPAQPAPVQSVETIRPIRADIARSFNTNGTLEAYETADLYPKVSGYLAEVRADIGDHVKAGQPLAIISLPETEKQLAQAEATIASKRANLALQQITLQRQEGLLKIQGTSQQSLDEAKANASVAAADVDLAVATADQIRTMLAYTRIVAPFDGVVSHRQVNRGDFVQAATAGLTTPLFTVQRVDVIRVFCNVPESDVSRLRVGLEVSVKPYGLEGKPISGKVTRFEGRLDPQTRNMRTEIDVPNPGGRLYPGMYAQVSLETDIHRNALTLPSSSVGTDANGKFVYAVQQGKIARLPVQTGMVEGGITEILGGLADQAEIMASVQGAPAPGTTVKSTPHA
ncbi:MAG TPA: efflux RND transporter periplasmic adaptor subunit [Micropepsaceae bacterium]|nr:efflux RND transporter periplasmic adaptor subunit [Micropepsaceae bacterium]